MMVRFDRVKFLTANASCRVPCLRRHHTNTQLYRLVPQARATLEYALQEQVKHKHKALASMRAQTEAADRLIAATAAALAEASAPAAGDLLEAQGDGNS